MLKFNPAAIRYLRAAQPITISLFLLLFIGAGLWLLANTQASTNTASLEAEHGTLSGTAQKVTASDASGSLAIAFRPATTASQTCSSVAQYGVTYQFDKAYPCGQFANGDYWVAPATTGGSVTLKQILPEFSLGRNGWMVNPATESNSYDSRLASYDAALMPALPYAAQPGSSIVKGISNPNSCGSTSGHPPCLITATVLTVLSSVPPENDSKTFRPPYASTFKPLYSVGQLRTDLLPSLAPVASAPSLESIKYRFQRVQLDHRTNWQGRYMHPIENFTYPNSTKVNNYGADLGKNNNDAALRLMLNDPIASKMPALINYVQAGIDWYGVVKTGANYSADGGHNNGKKLPVVFAAVLLNDAEMKSSIASSKKLFSEDTQVYFSTKIGKPLFGKYCTEGMYEKVRLGGSGSRDCRDPIQMIDGGETPGQAYQYCCTAKIYKGSSLAVRLLPGAKAVWDQDYFHDYVDRWVTFGTWTLPDDQNRFPVNHGKYADGGHYRSEFVEAMRAAYR